MALSNEIKTDLFRFFAIAFDAAPGTTYMDQLTQAVDAGMTVPQIVEVFTSKLQFTSVYPESSSSDEFATLLINNVVGDSASDAAKAEAVADVNGALAAGWTRGQVIYQIFSNLAAKPADDATWGGTSKMMANQVAVAQYATEVQLVSTANLYELKALIAEVTADTDVSTPAAIEAVIATGIAAATPGKTFTLTSGDDVFIGTAGSDTFDASTVIGSLKAADRVTDVSTTDNDVLNAKVTVATATPYLANIETINLTGPYGVVGIDATNISGTKTINLASSIASAAGTVSKITAAGVASVVAGDNISVLTVGSGDKGTKGLVSVDAGKATTVTLTGITNAADQFDFTVNGGATTLTAAGMTQTSDKLIVTSMGAANTVNFAGIANVKTIAVAGDQSATLKGDAAVFAGSTITKGDAQTVVLGITVGTNADLSKAAVSLIDLSAATTAATYTLADNANVKIGSTAVTLTGTADATAVNVDLTAVTATLASSVFTTVNLTANTTNVTATTVAAGADATVNLSGTKNVVVDAASTAKLLDATNLTGKLTATAQTLTNIHGGSGNDGLTVSTTSLVTVDGGAGNDIFTLTSVSAATLVGGEGTDTLKLSADVTLTTAATNFVATGFEKIDLSGKVLTLTSKQLEVLTGSGDVNVVDTAAATTSTFVVTGGTDSSNVIAANKLVFAMDGEGATITGGSLADTITGSNGNDIIGVSHSISGANGDDILTGGSGRDKFVLGAVEKGIATITDFVAGVDTIAIATSTATTAVANLFDKGALDTSGSSLTAVLGTFATSAANAAVAHTAYQFTYGGDTYVLINDSSAGYLASADTVVKITGVSGTLTAADIVHG